jgi:guanylate kinase
VLQGTETVRRLMPDVVTAFIAASSEAELVHRLVQRKTEDAEALLQRASTAREEVKQMRDFDYVVVNRGGEMEAAAARLSAIIDAERCRNGS